MTDNEGQRQARLAVWKQRAGGLSAGTMPGTQQLSRNGGENEGGGREPWKAGNLNAGLSSVCDFR